MMATSAKRPKRDCERDETADVASLAFGAIVASAAPSSGSSSRWAQLQAAGRVLRDGDYFYCRGKGSCKGWTQRMACDSKGGSSNAFEHAITCCMERLPAPLLLEALQLARGRAQGLLSKWIARVPPAAGASALLSSVRAEVQALSRSSGTLRPDMSFREKLNMLADAGAVGVAASGLPLDAVSSELVGSVVGLFDPACPIPSPDMIAARIPKLFEQTKLDMSAQLRRILGDSCVPRDFCKGIQTDMWTADAAAATENGFATTSCTVIDASGCLRTYALGVQHVEGRHDHEAILLALQEIMQHPFLEKSTSCDQLEYGIATSDTGASGKKACLIYGEQQQLRLRGLPPDGGLVALKLANEARRRRVDFWQPCVDHVAELAVKDVLNAKSNVGYPAIASIAEGITSLETFGNYFRWRGRIRALRLEIEKLARTQAEAGVSIADRIVYVGER